MQRLVLILLLLVIPFLAAYSDPTAEDRVFAFFPGLAQQLAANLPAGVSRDQAKTLLAAWYGRGNSELIRGMKMVLAGEGETNHALQLLLHLLASGCGMPEESMPLALALANNRLYAQVSSSIREAIKKDIVGHYALYLKIAAWQKTAFEFRIDLARMPLVAQLYWADRVVYPPEEIRYPIRTLSDYREFVDTIGTLEFFHTEAIKHRLYEGESMARIARNIFYYVHHKDAAGYKRHFYGPDETRARTIVDRMPHDNVPRGNLSPLLVRYRGKPQNINGFIWLNYQRHCLQATGHSVGLCEVSSLIEMAAFKGMGVPAGLMIRFPPKELRTTGHVFANWFDPVRRRWNNLEMIRSSDKQEHVYQLVVHKPVWHHRLPGLPDKAVDHAPAPRYFRLLKLGLQETHFTEVFFAPHTAVTNMIFRRDALPDDGQGRLADSDGDSIHDFEERLLGLDPFRPDTARDGVSDLWKLAYGYDPKTPLAAGSLDTPPIDGLGGGFTDRNNRLTTVTVRRHPGGPDPDSPEIDTMSAGIFGDRLYLRVTFHNDIRQCKRLNNYLSFVDEGGTTAFPGFSLLVDGNGVRPAGGNPKVADDYRGLRGLSIREVELMIPLRYFRGAGRVKIIFFTARVRGELTLPLR